MGLIRFLLAFSVVSSHSQFHPYFDFIGGELAVEAFFLISGFYITLSYPNYGNNWLFWRSRYLRLYPTYLFVLILTFIFNASGIAIVDFLELPIATKIFMVFSNSTLLFQDLFLFLNKDLSFNEIGPWSPNSLHRFLVILPAWSLGIELSFYILAPFLLKNSRLFTTTLTVSIATRIILIAIGKTDDPWSYRFFPSELFYFMMGSLAYRWKEKPLLSSAARRPLSWLTFIILLILTFSLIEINENYKKIFLYFSIWISLPGLFEKFRRNRLDNYLGALSYPIYICHMFFLIKFANRIYISLGEKTLLATFAIIGMICMAAIFLNEVIEKPINNRLRVRLGARKI